MIRHEWTYSHSTEGAFKPYHTRINHYLNGMDHNDSKTLLHNTTAFQNSNSRSLVKLKNTLLISLTYWVICNYKYSFKHTWGDVLIYICVCMGMHLIEIFFQNDKKKSSFWF